MVLPRQPDSDGDPESSISSASSESDVTDSGAMASGEFHGLILKLSSAPSTFSVPNRSAGDRWGTDGWKMAPVCVYGG